MLAMWKSLLLACLVVLPGGMAASSTSSSSSAASTSSSSSSVLAQLPDCALSCLATALADSPCTATNTTCMCTNEALQSQVTVCVTANCTVKEGLTTKNLTVTNCGATVRDQSGEYVVLCNTFAIIAGLFIIQRFASKIYWKMELGMDDWFILITGICAAPSQSINVYGTIANGLGRDIWTLPFEQITKFAMYFHVMAVLYFAQIPLLKLSLLFFYLRIFPTPIVRKLLWGTVIFNAVFATVYIFVAIFQCQPVSYFWKKWDGEHEGTCFNINIITTSNAAISIVVDIWMLAVPLSQLKGLNLDWKKKIGVGMMFCVGTFVTIVSILRLQAVVKFGDSQNATWDYVGISKWSTVEISVGIICACMPSLRLLLVRLFPSILATSQRYYANYGTNTNGQPKSHSRPQGAGVTSQVEASSHQRANSRGITCSRTYAVEYGETDETRLVHMKDLDRASARSDISNV
ncbi:hypothetical protein EDB81DRAFT_223173 [Dactylonectria macrodidyma]|uniref:CFEM domain-containing protein n=1 Tax=Dactylonectria macrodidyma TaxID=307937 RepID=A0A9P9DQW1_9HYPO|nr:hypothetical protein EDB81DRAFT_223173 [Dactylonectria macrodidyma]